MNIVPTPTSIPAFAHPVPVGADGIRFRKVHGPRTQQATQRRTAAGQAYTAALAARATQDVFAGHYLEVAP